MVSSILDFSNIKRAQQKLNIVDPIKLGNDIVAEEIEAVAEELYNIFWEKIGINKVPWNLAQERNKKDFHVLARESLAIWLRRGKV